ncbi:MAG: tetratricopeptide repeat protein [Lentisphaerae bacterium]|nr:tetratricopeptide repeat protein [Lentisphaerota bacterium]
MAAFEKILEAIPNDRLSLETLADAYAQVGDQERAQEYLLRLAQVYIEEKDEDAAHDLRKKIKALGSTDPRVLATLERIEQLKAQKVRAEVLGEASPEARQPTNIASEITFVWNLLQAQKLTEQEYADIVHDLSESSGKKTATPVSALHALRDRHFANIEEIMAFVAAACHTPVIQLARFELQPKAAALLPMPFMIRRGAIVFDLMGDNIRAGI